MTKVKILDKEFETFVTEEEMLKAIDRVAKEITDDLQGKSPLFVCILNGAFMFCSDLMKRLPMPCQLSFVKVASYAGTSSTGQVKQLIGFNEKVEGRTVVIVEDIVDTGATITNLVGQLAALGAADVRVATLLYKPDSCTSDIKPKYVGMEIPNDFVVGYGLDYDGYGRNLKNLYTLIK